MQKFTYKIGAQGAQDRAKQFMGNDIVRGIVELAARPRNTVGECLGV